MKKWFADASLTTSVLLHYSLSSTFPHSRLIEIRELIENLRHDFPLCIPWCVQSNAFIMPQIQQSNFQSNKHPARISSTFYTINATIIAAPSPYAPSSLPSITDITTGIASMISTTSVFFDALQRCEYFIRRRENLKIDFES